jgi:hypothetical protein
MILSKLVKDRRIAILAIALSGATACGSDVNTDWPRPSEPLDMSLYDLVSGPIDRSSAVNVVSGRSRGFPTSIRVDLIETWDIAFAVLDGEAVWLPRGFFEGFEPSSGILEAERDVDQLSEAPEDRELYEAENPVPVQEGFTYIIRSRSDPALSLPCRIYAKVRVDAVLEDPARIDFVILWNPNCDNRNLTPSPSQ